jgi:hypothetical protein
VNGVESVALGEEISWGFGGAADSGHLGYGFGWDAVIPGGLYDDIGNLVMATAGAE